MRDIPKKVSKPCDYVDMEWKEHRQYILSPVDAFAITLKWPQNGAACENFKFGHQHSEFLAYLKYGHPRRCWQDARRQRCLLKTFGQMSKNYQLKRLASYYKAETTFTFHFSILTLPNAFLGIDNREMESESGFSFAIASQPFPFSPFHLLKIKIFAGTLSLS